MMKQNRLNKDIVFAILMTLVLTVSGLYFIRLKVVEARQMSQLKTFITTFVADNGIDNMDNKEVTLLAQEIKASCDRYDLDPMLVVSIITVESSFDKEAESPVGARGLMQLMPNTARRISKEMGIKYAGDHTLYEIRANVMMGTYYLSKLSSKYKNNMKLYLAAYNYGPDHIDHVLKVKNHVPGVYYQKILRTYQKLS